MTAIRLAVSAQTDIVSLLARTQDRFSETARQRYEVLLTTSLRDIASDSQRPGSTLRPELGPAIRSYHLRCSRDRARALGAFVRRPRHLLLYRTITPLIIGVGRVLHDSMEVGRHLPTDFADDR